MHPVLAGFLMAWRERTPYAKDDDYVFPSFRLKGKKPLSASIMVQKYLHPAAIKAGVIKEHERVRFGFHNFRHSLASSLVKLKCDPKTVQGILRHEDVRTTMQLYAQSDQESKLEAQGKFLELLLGDKAHLLNKFFRMMVARDGVEPPTPAFSATLCCSLNDLTDFRWPPKSLRSP